jgi:hypothetical protein
MSKASHKCACEHENVSYCKTCKVCHCADCNQEWSAKGLTWQYYPYYQGTYTNGFGNQLGNTIQYKTTPTTLTEPLTSTVTCGHTK